MSKLKAILLSLGLSAIALSANANSLKMEMFKLNRDVNVLLEASNADEFREYADAFIAQVEKATEYLPRTINAEDNVAVEGYKQAMQELIVVVNDAAKIADDGNLDGAKEVTRKLFELKKQYHTQYK